MRQLTAADLAVLASPHYAVHVRVLVTDADGVERDLTDLEGIDWFAGAEWGEDIDQPIVQPRIEIRRDVAGTGLSLSPLDESSPLNRRLDGTYAPLIDAGRRIRILTATVPPGSVPAPGDWREVFDGEIDEVEWQSDPMLVVCRDPGGKLQDTIITDPREYGSESGVLLHVVMQQLLDDVLGPGVVTLHVPEPPAFMVTRYRPDEGPLLEALQACAGVIGWDVRYAWHEASQSFRLTLIRPDREKSVPDHVFGADDYIDVARLAVSRADVRNVVEVRYQDSGTHQQERVTVQDDASIARYGRRYMRIVEGEDSPIDTAPEALAMAEAALSDLAEPKAEQEIELRYFWPAQLGDLYLFRANGVHYTTDQTLAVVGIRHRLTEGQQRTVLVCRGRPSGGYLTWLKRSKREPDSTVTLYAECQARVIASDATSVTVQVDAVPDYGEVWLVGLIGAQHLSGPGLGVPAPSGTRWVFERPAFQAGEGQVVFRATAPGHESDDDHVVIPEQGRDTVPLTIRARVVSTTATTITVRVAVGDPVDPQRTGDAVVSWQQVGTGGVSPASPQTIPAANIRTTPDASESAGGYRDFTITRPAAGAGAGRVVFTVTRAGRVQDLDAVDVPEQTPTVYRSTECLARIVSSTATQVTVQVTATAEGGGTPQVELVGVTGATLASGASPGTKVASGSTWVFNRPAFQAGAGQAQFRATLAGATSDDDLVVIPEQGRDTVGLVMRASVQQVTPTQITVRVAVADPQPGTGAVTITYVATGGTGLAVSPASPQTIPAASVTSDLATTGYVDFTITRPQAGSGGGRVTFTATRSGRVPDVDAVDVPELPPTAVQIPPRALIRILEYTDLLDAIIQITGVAGEPTASPPTEYRWREYREGDTPGLYSVWLPLDSNRQATVTVARRPKGFVVVEAQVRTASGLESDPVTVRVAPTDGWQDDETGGPKWSSIVDDDGGQMALINEAQSKGQNLLGHDAGPERTITSNYSYLGVEGWTGVPIDILGLEPGEIISGAIDVQCLGAQVGPFIEFRDANQNLISQHFNPATPFGDGTYQRCVIEGITIPPGTVHLTFSTANVHLASGPVKIRRAMLNRGPKALPFDYPVFRPHRDSADDIRPGDSKALIHAAYVDEHGRPWLLHDPDTGRDIDVGDLVNPPSISGITLTVVDDGFVDHYTLKWTASANMSATWSVRAQFFREGVLRGTRTVPATNQEILFPDLGAGDGQPNMHSAIVELLNDTQQVVMTINSPVVFSTT